LWTQPTSQGGSLVRGSTSSCKTEVWCLHNSHFRNSKLMLPNLHQYSHNCMSRLLLSYCLYCFFSLGTAVKLEKNNNNNKKESGRPPQCKIDPSHPLPLPILFSLALSLSLYLNPTLSRHCCNFSLLPPLLVRLSIRCLYIYIYMYSVVWVTVGLLPLWHDLKIHIISYHILFQASKHCMAA